MKIEKDGNVVSLDGPCSRDDLIELTRYGKLERLKITKLNNLTVKIAGGLSFLESVKELFLWSTVNRTAMRYVIRIPELEVLDVLALGSAGNLKYFSEATSLKVFRCNHYMKEADLIEVAKLPKVREIGAQNSELTKRALECLMTFPNLETLDLEASRFDDKLAVVVSKSKTIKHLSIGSSKLTRKGLKKIVEMEQLESLDIWSTEIDFSDLALLSKLNNLRYLSVGGYEGQRRLLFKKIWPFLEEIPSLKRLWLDGIELNEDEKNLLSAKYEYFRN